MRKICEEKRIRDDGTSLIYFQYFPDATHRVFLNTVIAIPPKYWDARKQRIKDNLPATPSDHEQLNKEFTRQFRMTEDLIGLAKSNGIENAGTFIKEKFNSTLNLENLKQRDWRLRRHTETPEKSFFCAQLEDYIKTKGKKVRHGTLSVFKSM